MKKRSRSFGMKAAAVFAVTVTFFSTVLLAFGIVFLYAMGGYEGTSGYAKINAAEFFMNKYADSIRYMRNNGRDPFLRYDGANFWLEIRDSDGRVVQSNYHGEEILCRIDSTDKENGETYTLYAKPQPTQKDLMGSAYHVIDAGFGLMPLWISLAALGGLTTLALFVYLVAVAGMREDSDTPQENLIDHIPYDLFLAIYGFVVMFEYSLLHSVYNELWRVAMLAVLALADFLLLILLLMSTATRLKTGTILKKTVLVQFCFLIGRTIKKLFRGGMYVIRRLPLIWKTVLIAGGVSFGEFLAILLLWNRWDGLFLVFWAAEKAVLIPMLLLFSISMRKLQIGGEQMEAGAVDFKINTAHMPYDLKKHGETLNHLNAGMQRAVDEKMKSERMKTELITNVSHDIKTPLTSIINYTDLIEKEPLENERVKGYVEVLKRQSSRLKKLIEDLVEASKASSGCLPVNLQELEVGVLLSQAVGEYQERMERADQMLVLTQPQEPVRILADGRLLWRVFDNLLNNAFKYSQPNTRVYLTLEKIGNRAVVVFRNISKVPLNISSDELMERFVRGDSSRNTEGSGLGLSIAKSLTELQGGDFRLIVDGDLFKAMVSFAIID